MNRLEIVKDVAMEYIIMMDNGVMDGQLTQEEYNEAVSFEKVYDYTLSEANQECKFLGGKVLTFLVHEAIEEYA